MPIEIVYRSEKGSPLSAAEIDQNFATLAAAVEAGGYGQINTASNRITPDSSTSFGWYHSKSGVDLRFKNFRVGAGLVITKPNDTEILLNLSGSIGGGETNIATSIPDAVTPVVTKSLIIAKDGVNLPFKALKAGANVTLTSDGDSITIASSLGVGESIFTSNGLSEVDPLVKNLAKARTGSELPFKSLKQGSNITLTSDGNSVTISATGGGGGAGTVTNGVNLVAPDTPTSKGLFVSEVGGILRFKNLRAGAGVSFDTTTSATEIIINTTGQINDTLNKIADSAPNIRGLVFGKSGQNTLLRSLQAGANIALSSSDDTVTIAVTGISGAGEINAAGNLGIQSGSVIGLYASKDVDGTLRFKSLRVGSNISLSTDANHIDINAINVGEVNTGANLGTQSGTIMGLYDSKPSTALRFKSIEAGTGITLTSTANTVKIDAAAGSGEANDLVSVGTGETLVVAKDLVHLRVKGLTAGPNIILTPTATDIEISVDPTGLTGGSSSSAVATTDITYRVGTDFANFNAAVAFLNAIPVSGKASGQVTYRVELPAGTHSWTTQLVCSNLKLRIVGDNPDTVILGASGVTSVVRHCDRLSFESLRLKGIVNIFYSNVEFACGGLASGTASELVVVAEGSILEGTQSFFAKSLTLTKGSTGSFTNGAVYSYSSHRIDELIDCNKNSSLVFIGDTRIGTVATTALGDVICTQNSKITFANQLTASSIDRLDSDQVVTVATNSVVFINTHVPPTTTDFISALDIVGQFNNNGSAVFISTIEPPTSGAVTEWLWI